MKRILTLLVVVLTTQLSFGQGGGQSQIRLSTEVINTNQETERQLLDKLSDSKAGSHEGFVFKILQFNEIPSLQLRSNWEQKGIVLLDYLPDLAYFAMIREGADVSDLTTNLKSVLEVDNRFKWEAPLYRFGIPPHARTDDGGVKMVVTYYKGLDPQRIIDQLSSFGKVTDHRVYSNQLDLQIKENQLATITALPYLQFIGASDPDPELENPYWRGTGRANYLDSGVNGMNFTGAGVTVAVGEGGVLGQDNLEYKGRITEMNSGTSGHKLGVGLRAAGAGNLNPRNRGVAYGSDILSVNSSPNYSALYNSHNLRFTNHSLGYGIVGFYSQSARNFDLYVKNDVAGMVFYSAGNSGNNTGFSPYDNFQGYGNLTGSRKQFKNNVLCASLNALDQSMSFSSKGPTYDGRLAPHLAQEGSAGTSHSAPKMIGSFAVLSEVYTTYNSGMEAPSSLLKAVMMNTADDIGVEGIDFRTGYGRVNLRRAHDLIQSNQIIAGSIDNGVTEDHVISVPANTHQLRVLVYWRDEPAAVNAATALVNDIDLSVEDPSSTVTLPWVLNSTPDLATLDDSPTRMVDHLNNVEQVTIDAPVSGNYTISLEGFNIPTGPQEYFLVYEFLNEGIQITDPIKNQRLVPGENHYIYWDAYTNSNLLFVLQYRINGGAWTNIDNVGSDVRAYNWTVPDPGAGIFDVEIRIVQGGLSSTTDISTIGDIPQNVVVTQHCQDTLYLTWDPLPGATTYNLYLLGSKYMTLQGANATVNGNTGKIGGLIGQNEVYYAVSAVTNGKEGRKTDAQSSENDFNLISNIQFDNINVDGCAQGGATYAVQFCALDDLIITPSRGFQVSLSLDSTFVDTLIISPSANGIEEDIFVKLDPDYLFGIGTWEGSISHVSGMDEEIVNIDPFTISCAGQKSSNALKGNESGETVTITGLNWNNPTDFTIEWWLNPTTYNNWNQQVGNGWGNFLFHANSNGSFSAGVANNGSRINSPVDQLELNRWQHIAFVKSGNNFTLYHNGESVGTSSSSSNVNWGDFTIGESGGHSINGYLDEFRMWETARTEQEIRESMHLTIPGDSPGLRVYLQFNSDAGNIVDYSPNCYPVINNGFSREKSTAPVAGGVSITKNILNGGRYSFDNGVDDTNIDIDFNNAPGGDVVMTYLREEGPHGELPNTLLETTDEYWIMHNYGTAGDDLGMYLYLLIDTVLPNQQVLDFSAAQRGHNSETVWSDIGNPASINGDTLEFPRFTGIQQFALSTTVEPDSIAGRSLNLPGGISDFVSIDALNLNSNSVTLSAWIKPDGVQADWAGILFSRDGSTTAGISILNSNELRYTWNGGNWSWASGAFVNPDEWNHIVLAIEPTKTTIYLNGVPHVHNVANSAEAFNGELRIGSDQGFDTRIFKGEIDEVVIWNKALTQDEVRAHRHLTKHNIIDSDMELYLQFNTERKVNKDVTGNGNDGMHNGQITTTVSDAPVGSGSSDVLQINSAGYYESNNGVGLNFIGSSHPDGQIRVFRMDGSPYKRPSLYDGPSNYWIVNNYGNNITFSDMDSLSFDEVDHFSGGSNPNQLSLYSRGENGHIDNWSMKGTDPSLDVDNALLGYKSSLTVIEMGQFLLVNEGGINWVGAKNTAWDEPYNWLPAKVPTEFDEAIIRAHTKYQPIVELDIDVKAIIMQPDSRLIQMPNTLMQLKK